MRNNITRIHGRYVYHWIKHRPMTWFSVYQTGKRGVRQAVFLLKGNICTPGQTRHHLRIARAT